MDFEQYLLNRHLLIKDTFKIGETSAKQYNNRLENLRKHGIYKDENILTNEMIDKINNIYVNKTSEYERTIKYYLEYKKYNKTIK